MARTLSPEDLDAVRDALMLALGPRIDAVDRTLDTMGDRITALEARFAELEARLGSDL